MCSPKCCEIIIIISTIIIIIVHFRRTLQVGSLKVYSYIGFLNKAHTSSIFILNQLQQRFRTCIEKIPFSSSVYFPHALLSITVRFKTTPETNKQYHHFVVRYNTREKNIAQQKQYAYHHRQSQYQN